MNKKFHVKVQENWCKGCGICVGFCPANILSIAVNGKLKVESDDKCIGCKACELRCPDFAIEVEAIENGR